MRILVAGSSGFLGSHLTERLRSGGHDVVRLVRRAASGPDEATWDPYAGRLDRDLVERADVVVNLAGTPTAGNPHSSRWARELRESRVTTTAVLSDAIAESDRRPAFLAQNGIGYYGDHGSEPVDETTPSRDGGMLTDVCREWQQAADSAVAAGARVCFLRTAPVMDRSAPPLQQMRLAWLAGLGARIGDGRQHFAMVSLHDWVEGTVFLAEADDAAGAFNLSCPRTPTNAEFTDALAVALGRRAFLKVPARLVEVGAGRLAPELLGSVNAVPAALEGAGYRFRDGDVGAVLAAGLS